MVVNGASYRCTMYNLHNHMQQPCFRELTWVELENGRVQILGVSSPTMALPLLLLNPFLCSLSWFWLQSFSFSLILPQLALPLLFPSHVPNPQVVLPLWNLLWSNLISNKQPLLLLSLSDKLIYLDVSTFGTLKPCWPLWGAWLLWCWGALSPEGCYQPILCHIWACFSKKDFGGQPMPWLKVWTPVLS